MRHFLSMNQFSEEEIFNLLELAEDYRQNPVRLKKQLFAANLFFEPSTRTKMSFVVAEKKLGLEVLDFHSESSSVLKGESLYDTAKTFESIGANVLVIRHESDNWFEGLENEMAIPMINAGAGTAEHPTQCMLDLLTIYQEFGTFEGLTVAIVGDIKHSRVAHSNAYTFARLGANILLSAPPGFEDQKMDFPYRTIDEAVQQSDVLMLLRVQHERHVDPQKPSDYLARYGLTKTREKMMKKHAILLHPAPINRGIEIDSDLVECDRSRIFKQMENGVYVRMAILTSLLKEWGTIE